ncbi:MAG: ribosome assembly cofactor RimP [Bacteroidales bacterium]|jgi:ribosome maturation factor RimP|nr:ribosome assembly cofactor RimP [Bacteroidales bacterium]HOL98543.1 ribosome assembly cofactor RimP [Bacteroidales bacterium]HOM35702.1 ribosome assembly cofactor RimP [Bacteroidales bacterium]HPD23158.1 ribosome assembly cofactor RimP [Bacteroidales bacterium]HRS99087.1 ribosome assembly cofactor RimP [Bacteroidales bacterium]
MIEVDKIKDLCLKALKNREFLVDVKVSRNNEIVVCFDCFDGIKIERCLELSRYIEENLDREHEDFSLEVGSPGLSVAFKVIEQYQKNIGKQVDIVKKDGTKKRVVLNEVHENYVLVSPIKENKSKDNKEIKAMLKIEFNEIKSTKLVF